jgi:hypothetical protein
VKKTQCNIESACKLHIHQAVDVVNVSKEKKILWQSLVMFFSNEAEVANDTQNS